MIRFFGDYYPPPMIITQVAAIGANNELGEQGELPWDLPDDLKHFKAVTDGKPVLMGRKTHQSIGRLLPGRENYVLTRSGEGLMEGAIVVNDLEEFIEQLHHNGTDELMVIGGGEVYDQMMPFSHRLIITHVHGEFPQADAFYPDISPHEWEEFERESHTSDDDHKYAFDIVSYARHQRKNGHHNYLDL